MNLLNRLVTGISLVVTLSSSATSIANAALVSRLGGLAYYDNVSNLTWLADANYSKTSHFDSDGLMDWNTANSWAASLNISGVSNWRLANLTDVGADGCTNGVDCGYNVSTTISEMAGLYYGTLGNTSGPGGLVNTGPFSNVKSFGYWTGVESVSNPNKGWGFAFGSGYQGTDIKTDVGYAWAVHSGDVGVGAVTAVIPLPAAVWLFGSGLLGLVMASRRK